MCKRLLKIEEVASIINVSIQRAYELLRIGIIPCVRLGTRQVRVSEEVLNKWIEQGGCNIVLLRLNEQNANP
jgi:excisionase family DNA binding protein